MLAHLNMLDICEYIAAHILTPTPSAEALLLRSAENTLCTNTQCFSDYADAFGMHDPYSRDSDSSLALLAATSAFISVWAIMRHRKALGK